MITTINTLDYTVTPTYSVFYNNLPGSIQDAYVALYNTGELAIYPSSMYDAPILLFKNRSYEDSNMEVIRNWCVEQGFQFSNQYEDDSICRLKIENSAPETTFIKDGCMITVRGPVDEDSELIEKIKSL